MWNVTMNKLPEHNTKVIGYWISVPEPFSGLCYYTGSEWIFCENLEIISEPDYWIDLP